MQNSYPSAAVDAPSLAKPAWVSQKAPKAFAHIPGPKPRFLIGNIADFMKGQPAWQVLADYGQRYGGLSVFWMFSRPSVVLNDPDLIQQVLLTPEQQSFTRMGQSRCPVAQAMNFYKNLPRKALRPMLTDTSTFIAQDQGTPWQYLSQNHPFNLSGFEDWLRGQMPIWVDFLGQQLQSLGQDPSPVPAYETLQRLTFDGFAIATVGQMFPTDVFRQFQQMCAVGTQRMSLSAISNGFILRQPWSWKYRRASQQWFSRFRQIVADAQGQNSNGSSLLHWVLAQGESALNPEQMSHVCAEVYPGGAVSTPSGLTSALYLLWQHPQILESLRGEVDQHFSEPMTWEHLEGCQILDQVVRETLRLRPPVPFFTRNVGAQDVQLAGYSIPAQTQLFIPNGYLHRHPEHWADPETFQPSRWDRATVDQNPYGSDYFFPFGRGDRSCIGQHFARAFLKLALAVIIQRLDFKFETEPDTAEFYFAVAVPKKLKISFSPR